MGGIVSSMGSLSKEHLDKLQDKLNSKPVCQDSPRTRYKKVLERIIPEPFMKNLDRDISETHSKNIEGTVLLADMVGFSLWAESKTSDVVMDMLNCWFMVVDDIRTAMVNQGILAPHFVETIGDAILLTAGLPTADDDHANTMVRFALHLQSAVSQRQRKFKKEFGYSLCVRIGLNSGPVSSCVVKPLNDYRVFGHTVNWAARMESSAPLDVVGQESPIHISTTTAALLPKGVYVLRKRVVNSIKWHKDENVETFLVMSFAARRGDGYFRTRACRPRQVFASDRRRVLVVDDSKATLGLFKRCLEDDEFCVHTASNSIDALTVFQNEVFDAVLVDLIIPGVDGYSIAQQIRKAEGNAGKVVMVGMTSDIVDKAIETKTCSSGMDDVWHKAFDTEELKGRVRKLIAMRKASTVLRSLQSH